VRSLMPRAKAELTELVAFESVADEAVAPRPYAGADHTAVLGEDGGHAARDGVRAALGDGPAGGVSRGEDAEPDGRAERVGERAERVGRDSGPQRPGLRRAEEPGEGGGGQDGRQPEAGERQRMRRDPRSGPLPGSSGRPAVRRRTCQAGGAPYRPAVRRRTG
ncbi:hypothetical protein ACWCQ0_48085, partial [Streptomyces massasporeus]